MKSFSSTLIFGIVVVIIASFAYWELKESDRERSSQSEGAKLLPYWDQEGIVHIEIFNNGKVLILDHDDTGWKILKPITDNADSSGVNSFISAIMADEVLDLNADTGVNWSQFGLDSEERYINIKHKDSREEKIYVSSKKSFDGKYYLKYAGKSRLYLGSTSWENWLNRSASDLRNKKLFLPDDKIVGLSLTPASKVHLNFTFSEDMWSLSEDSEFDLDQEKVKSLILSLQNFRATDVVSETIEVANLKKFGLEKPELRLDLMLENGTRRVFYVSKAGTSSDDVFLYTSDRPYIYKTTKSITEKWNAPKENYKKEIKEISKKSKTEDEIEKDSHHGHEH